MKARVEKLVEELQSTRDDIAKLDALRQAGLSERYLALRERELALEREIAKIRGIAYAVELVVPKIHFWLQIYLIGAVNRDAIAICETDKGQSVECFEFLGTREARIGTLNDEVYEGHELFGRGLGVYGLFEIFNSTWASSYEKACMVHPNYDQYPVALRHFLIRAKDGEFACLAERFSSRKISRPYNEIVGGIENLITTQLQD